MLHSDSSAFVWGTKQHTAREAWMTDLTDNAVISPSVSNWLLLNGRQKVSSGATKMWEKARD